MTELATARLELATALETALGVHAYPAPPPSLVPPCAVVIPGTGYLVGPRTGCSYAVVVTVRLVAGTHEQQGAYDQLDAMLHATIAAAGAVANVSVAERDYGGSRYLCADALVSYAVDMRAPALT